MKEGACGPDKKIYNCYLSRAIHLPSFAEILRETADFCGKLQKTLVMLVFKDLMIISIYWIEKVLLIFACEIRWVTAKFCEDEGVWVRLGGV